MVDQHQAVGLAAYGGGAPMTVTAEQRSQRRTTLLVAGLVALLVAILSWVGYLGANTDGHRAWSKNPVPPASVALVEGKPYHLSTAAGPAVLKADSVQCTYTTVTSLTAPVTNSLAVTVSRGDARVTHVIGSFTSPVTGRVSVQCPQVAAVFVDDAASAPFDKAGALVVLTALFALIGVALVLQALYGGSAGNAGGQSHRDNS
jgi:hypothetical protein